MDVLFNAKVSEIEYIFMVTIKNILASCNYILITFKIQS